MRFLNPLALLLLLLVPLVWAAARRAKSGRVRFSALRELRLARAEAGGRTVSLLPLALRCAAIGLVAVGLARPVRGISHTKVYSEGIDIVLALDVSSSMDARDMTDSLEVNRLDAVKEVVKRFIPERRNDRIGVTAFARYAYTQAPLTLDHDILIDLIDRLKIVPQGGDEDGTAIGSAVLTSAARLKESKAKSKVIILLTDGMNNYGEVGPEAAAEAAKALGLKIYTIGAGSSGLVPYPAQDMFGQRVMTRVQTDIDEEGLRKIAALTGGEYYRAQDEQALREIYDRINKMEKTEIEEEKFLEYRDLFPLLIIPALLLLLAEAVLANTVLRRLP